MGLFDTITNALGVGQQGANENGADAGGLGSLLQQGGPGASGGIGSELLAGFGGGQAGSNPFAGGQGGAMAGMLETLAANGLGQQVSSWMINNPNLPVSPRRIHDAVGFQQVQRLAQSTGRPVGDFLRDLAEHLPTATSRSAGIDPL